MAKSNGPFPPLTETEMRALIALYWPNDAVDINGLSVSARDVALEIARAESGFDPDIIGDEGEVGLFQIHPPAWLVELNNAGIGTSTGPLTVKKLEIPNVNVAAAAYIYKKSGFGPWTTWEQVRQDYIRRRNAAGPVESNVHEEGLYPGQLQLEGTIGGIIGSIDDVGDFLRLLASTLFDPQFWKRVGLGVLGAAVILVALMLYGSKTELGQSAIGVASKGTIKPK